MEELETGGGFGHTVPGNVSHAWGLKGKKCVGYGLNDRNQGVVCGGGAFEHSRFLSLGCLYSDRKDVVVKPQYVLHHPTSVCRFMSSFFLTD